MRRLTRNHLVATNKIEFEMIPRNNFVNYGKRDTNLIYEDPFASGAGWDQSHNAHPRKSHPDESWLTDAALVDGSLI